MSQMTHPVQGSQSPGQDNARMFPTMNDLPEGTRGPIVQHLNQSLADTTDLSTQMKFAHWNVKGMNFYQLHLLFDEIAEVLEAHADMLAERATSLGGQAMGTARMAVAHSRIPEMSPETTTGPQFVEEAAEHLAVHAANLRADIDCTASDGDEDTADLYTEISREVDQQLYFLESHLQTESIGPVGQFVSGQTVGDTHQPGRTVQGQQPAQQQPPQQGQPPQRTTFTGATPQGQQSPAQFQQQPQQQSQQPQQYQQPQQNVQSHQQPTQPYPSQERYQQPRQ